MPLLDAQPQCGQVLAQEVGSCEEPVLEGFKLWSEVLWCYRWEIFLRKKLYGIFNLEDDILSGLVIEDGCDCTSETTEGYKIWSF